MLLESCCLRSHASTYRSTYSACQSRLSIFTFMSCVCTYVGVFVTSVAMPHVEQMYTHVCIL